MLQRRRYWYSIEKLKNSSKNCDDFHPANVSLNYNFGKFCMKIPLETLKPT